MTSTGTLHPQVGDTVWVFDINRRIYQKPPPGKIYPEGGPIYREHWVAKKIIGETSRSWLVEPTWRPVKISKRGPHHGICFSIKDVDDACWKNEHAHKIIGSLSANRLTKDQLLVIADMSGYKIEEQPK